MGLCRKSRHGIRAKILAPHSTRSDSAHQGEIRASFPSDPQRRVGNSFWVLEDGSSIQTDRQIYSGLSSISYNGFNAYTNFNVSVNGSGSQSASLSLGGNQVVSSLDGVPEPGSGVLFFGGISMIILYWLRAKRIKA
jgi:hypothetical protein